jgi:CheY-like chemotaxis protein
LKILIAEDEKISRIVLEASLKKRGHDVIAVGKRSQGLGGVSTRLLSGDDFRLDDAGNGWTSALSQNPRIL